MFLDAVSDVDSESAIISSENTYTKNENRKIRVGFGMQIETFQESLTLKYTPGVHTDPKQKWGIPKVDWFYLVYQPLTSETIWK